MPSRSPPLLPFLAGLLLSCCVMSTHSRGTYPAYCSAPESMQSRSIPPVVSETPVQLLQTHVLIRHGSRTPWGDFFCWSYDGAEEPNGIGPWDCDDGTIMAPYLKSKSKAGGSGSGSASPDADVDAGSNSNLLLFNRVYDALSPPIENVFGGTCLKGQLIEAGYEQQRANGRILREAYIETSHRSMRLFDSIYYSDRPYEQSTRFRGDDMQRTLVSGQTLVTALFDVPTTANNGTDIIVPYHTADYDVDPIKIDFLICPKLTDLKKEAYASDAFIALNRSDDVSELSSILTNHLGGAQWDACFDCLLTQKCNDRPVPPILDDFRRDGDDSLFSRVARHYAWLDAFPFRHDDAALSKLAMGPMWAEILAHVSNARGARTLDDMREREVPMLLLYSGHDWTLMAIMASLGNHFWDGAWCPYSSMFVVETYYDPTSPSAYAFRIIYNGEVLTQRIDGCDGDLCDLDILTSLVEPFATWDRDCASTAEKPPSPTGEETPAKRETTRSQPVGAFVWIGTTLFLCVISSLSTMFYLTGHILGRKKGAMGHRSYGAMN